MDAEQLNAALSFIRKPTAQLRKMLLEKANSAAPHEFESVMNAVRSLFEKYTRTLSDAPPGRARAMRFHALIDSAMEAARSLPVSCRKGCSGCCHFAVEITSDEAELLRDLLDAGIEIDLGKLARQSSLELDSAAWRIPWSDESRCVFLGSDFECRIYEHRPVACRKLVVTTPADLCASSSSKIEPVRVLIAETIVSAAISLNGCTQGTLSQMLVESLGGPQTAETSTES